VQAERGIYLRGKEDVQEAVSTIGSRKKKKKKHQNGMQVLVYGHKAKNSLCEASRRVKQEADWEHMSCD